MSELRLELGPLALRLRRPLATGAGVVQTVAGVRLRVEGDGRVGLGEATPLPGRGEEVTRTWAALRLVAQQGIPPPAGIEDVMTQVARLPEEVPAARFGLELALLDWLAQGCGVSVARLLSPDARMEVVVNALVDEDQSDTLAESSAQAVDQGFGTLKLKIGARSLEADLDRVRAVRSRVGNRIRLRVDANGAWPAPLAKRALDALGDLGVELCEQPVPADALGALEELALDSPCPIAADESTPRLLGRSLPTAIRIFVLKPAALGGLCAALAAARRCEARGAESYVTAGFEGAVARAGAFHLAAALPHSERAHGLATGAWIEGAEGRGPPGGCWTVPTGPGLGITEAA